MNSVFDLAVIGGGPAGTSAAIHAARNGHRVLLLERGHFPRQKVCGEFVSSEALGLLEGLMAHSAEWNTDPLEISHARIFVDGKLRETAIAPPANSIPRFVMDAALWRAAGDARVTAMANHAVKGTLGRGPFQISTELGLFSARAVINAAGRWSVMNAGSHPSENSAIGLKRHFYESAPSSSVDLYFFDGGYCGVQPIAADEINVSAMVSRKVAKTLEDVLSLEPHLAERSKNWRAVTEVVSTYPLILREPRPVTPKQNILNAGDAAGFIDPFVGDGISMALHSGRMAAACLDGFLRGRSSLAAAVSDYSQQYANQLLPAFRNARRLRRVISSPSMRNIAMGLFGIPAISQLALRSTRARVA